MTFGINWAVVYENRKIMTKGEERSRIDIVQGSRGSAMRTYILCCLAAWLFSAAVRSVRSELRFASVQRRGNGGSKQQLKGSFQSDIIN